jgi:hypothetical protein
VFFASADMFADSFELRDTAASVIIDLSGPILGCNVGRRFGRRRHQDAPAWDAGGTQRLIQASATLVDRHGPLI